MEKANSLSIACCVRYLYKSYLSPPFSANPATKVPFSVEPDARRFRVEELLAKGMR